MALKRCLWHPPEVPAKAWAPKHQKYTTWRDLLFGKGKKLANHKILTLQLSNSFHIQFQSSMTAAILHAMTHLYALVLSAIQLNTSARKHRIRMAPRKHGKGINCPPISKAVHVHNFNSISNIGRTKQNGSADLATIVVDSSSFTPAWQVCGHKVANRCHSKQLQKSIGVGFCANFETSKTGGFSWTLASSGASGGTMWWKPESHTDAFIFFMLITKYIQATCWKTHKSNTSSCFNFLKQNEMGKVARTSCLHLLNLHGNIRIFNQKQHQRPAASKCFLCMSSFPADSCFIIPSLTRMLRSL